jgi:hypothetical protein
LFCLTDKKRTDLSKKNQGKTQKKDTIFFLQEGATGAEKGKNNVKMI